MRFTFKIIDAYSFQIYSGHIVLIKKIGFKIKKSKCLIKSKNDDFLSFLAVLVLCSTLKMLRV